MQMTKIDVNYLNEGKNKQIADLNSDGRYYKTRNGDGQQWKPYDSPFHKMMTTM